MATPVNHPYYPRDLLLPHYVANTLGMDYILTVLFSTFGVILLAAGIIIFRKRVSAGDRLIFMWCVICGFIHMFLEGYFAVFHSSLAGDQAILGQVWKEYSKGDSRYLSSDSFVVNMERITAFIDGPLAFYTAYAIYTNSPGRHVAQISVSICQLYGCVLYYLTTLFEGSPHCDPHPLYFWFYFVVMNAFWTIIPIVLINQSWGAIYRGMAVAQKAISSKKHK
ncbi:Emopamil-binding protein [Basidiobolus meristosporus CBS 931.73]|uniref:Emopamil-binding protein n=1 Tax=Basidiobolus meristosporus CBS 931.73 TaxID=1314790 RepID=A0A1Y1ZDU0_9FUNG|nr:Emopamil-binding protein [Basidiobolus meristosporus CBS 931.73]ORY07965.1 Emopamil-binding protein [Basidiobolus meristosporus CBS 931.73]|eukprot:ORX63945.1 Emopamil-binding protein [Basidiobolus meristosporus CBS 931.73]